MKDEKKCEYCGKIITKKQYFKTCIIKSEIHWSRLKYCSINCRNNSSRDRCRLIKRKEIII